jgi:translation initiation factor 1A
MVKNTTGGNKAKSQGRKHLVPTNRVLRLSKEEDEIYAIVTRNLGSGNLHVLCQDNVTRLCHIRGKFRGRGKKDNIASIGSYLLVGLRSFESVKEDSKKLQNCDMLEVYQPSEKEELKKKVTNIDWSLFTSTEDTSKGIDDDIIEFTDNTTEDDYNSYEQGSHSNIVIDNTPIDIDDI